MKSFDQIIDVLTTITRNAKRSILTPILRALIFTIPVATIWIISFFHKWSGLEFGFYWYSGPLWATYFYIFILAVTITMNLNDKFD